MSPDYDRMVNEVRLVFSVLKIPAPEKLFGVDVFLPVIERMRKDGAVVVIKVDGGRTRGEDNPPFTAVVSGGPLKGDYYRTDAETIELALMYVITNYARLVWSIE